MPAKIKIGISSCLLGEKTRYDGGHKQEWFITETWGPHLELVPVCPEVECGLGVPREVMRLEGDAAAPRLLTVKTRKDHTDLMLNWTRERLAELDSEDLWGFIFKSNSPSCGPARVKVYGAQGKPRKQGVGLFAASFQSRFPLLPVADEVHLRDPQFRENFLERLFTLRRWREILGEKWSLDGLLNFHRRHQLLLLAHGSRHYRALNRLISRAGEIPGEDLCTQYQTLFLEALRLKATPGKHFRVLGRIRNSLKKKLAAADLKELEKTMDSYRRRDLPLVALLVPLDHCARKYGQSDLQEQYYLHPHPQELLLRFHA